MKIPQPKLKSLSKQIKIDKSKSKKKHWYFIEITFNRSAFYKRLENIIEFFVILSNNKNSIAGKSSNKNWWSLLSPKVNIKINTSEKMIKINLIIKTVTKIDILDFKKRVKEIVPYHEINIGYKDPKERELEKEFDKLFFPNNQSNKILFKKVND
jgi:hypothetical protein